MHLKSILATTVTLGMTVRALDTVISMTGLIAATVVGFVIPVMIIVKVFCVFYVFVF